MKPRLFLSHPWASNAHHFASRLVSNLRSRGYVVWLDEHEMLPGQQIAERQTVGIESETDVFVFTLAQASLDSKNCMSELSTAVVNNKPIIAIRLDDAPAPSSLATRIAVDFTNPVYFEASIDRLTQGCAALYRMMRVVRTLDDDNPEIRSEAARILRDLRSSDALPAVLERAHQERDDSVLYWMLVAAGNLVALRADLMPEVVSLLQLHALSDSAIARRGALEGSAALEKSTKEDTS